ncbi:hypothetical protein [Bradyrhizobium yuanmingense]|uniref:hypothetical protein n=1 Tax=Bradyrhizobium yuanmingense TaxID=108015 RepID=UPI0035197F82
MSSQSSHGSTSQTQSVQIQQPQSSQQQQQQQQYLQQQLLLQEQRQQDQQQQQEEQQQQKLEQEQQEVAQQQQQRRRRRKAGFSPAYCNAFLIKQVRPQSAQQRARAIRRERFFHGTLDQAEELESGQFRLLFGVVSGSWFASNAGWAKRAASNEQELVKYLAAIPLFLIEIDLDAATIEELAGRRGADLQSGVRPMREAPDRALLSLERRWVTIETGRSGARGALVFNNLFEAPSSARVLSIRTSSLATRTSLNTLDPLRRISDATLNRIGQELPRTNAIGALTVFDVGQGEAIGLTGGGHVSCYFDFGGGVASNRKTFPTRLKQFCLCNRPPIILSHWDHDHWSSAGRDTRAYARTWIVPRQSVKSSKRAPHHSALLGSIRASRGTILVWPRKVAVRKFGQVVIQQCTGSSKNSSGLALSLLPPKRVSGKPALLPADAGYGDLPRYPKSGGLDAIVCPHHGGKSHSPTVPHPPGRSYRRLFYTYGKGNTYGHPLTKTYQDHHTAKWTDKRVKRPPPDQLARNTADRNRLGLGHIGFDWTTSKSLAKMLCSVKRSLDDQQK